MRGNVETGGGGGRAGVRRLRRVPSGRARDGGRDSGAERRAYRRLLAAAGAGVGAEARGGPRRVGGPKRRPVPRGRHVCAHPRRREDAARTTRPTRAGGRDGAFLRNLPDVWLKQGLYFSFIHLRIIYSKLELIILI